MLSPLFTEVKLRKGIGQAFPGMNPSGGPAFMYQMQTAPAAAPLGPTPTPVPAPAALPTPTVAVPAGSTPALPPSPAPAEVVSPKYVAEAIALVAFLGAILIPSSH